LNEEYALAREKKCSIGEASGTYQPPEMVGIDDGAAGRCRGSKSNRGFGEFLRRENSLFGPVNINNSLVGPLNLEISYLTLLVSLVLK